MSKSKRKLPPEYLIVPNTNKRHVHRVGLVKSRDAYDRPLLIEIVHNQDEKIDIVKNPDLITMYVPEVITVIKEDEA